MATNNIKPFATSSSANILKDEELATRSELQTGFPFKSKADSKLVGKLMQNATASAYAVGQFSAKYGTTDITGSDATGFATAFETAIKNIISTSGSGYKGEVDSFADLPEDATVGDIYSIHMSSNGTDTFFIKVQNNQWCQLSPSAYYSNDGSFVSAMLVTGLENDPKSAGSHVIATRNTLDNTADFSLAANANTSSGEYKTVSIVGSIETDQAQIFMKADNITLSGATEFSKPVTVQAPAEDMNPATKQYVDSAIPDTSNFATKDELTAKADASALANYAPLANPALTGTATLNGQNVATVNQIPDTSHFVTDTTLADYPTSEMVEAEFSSYDKNIKAHIESELTGYAPLTGAAFSGAVTVQEPTAASNPATKQYVDSAVASVYKYKGSVANQSALPSSNQVVGDVYNVEDTGDNFAWDGTQWDKLAGTVDLSAYLTIANASSTYQPKGDYATTSALTAKADASALANYAPLANPAFTGTATLGGQTIATVNQIPDTSAFITSTPSANLVTASAGITIDSEKQVAGIGAAAGASMVRLSEAKAEIVGDNGIEIASPNIYIGGGDNRGYALSLTDSNGLIISQNDQTLLSIVQGTITTHNSQDESVINNLSERLVSAEGYRASLAGYEYIAVNNRGALTVNQDSIESQQVTTATTITVSDGSAKTAWVKKVSIKDAGVTISLGSAWSWAGGSQPTVTAPSLLILSWDNDCGIAILQTTGS